MRQTVRQTVREPVPVGTTAPRTVGVAIAIPEPFAAALQEHRASFGDPLADAIPPHITLLPPTLLSPTLLPPTLLSPTLLPPTLLGPAALTGSADVVAHLTEVAAGAAPFTIHLRGSATFRPVSPVVFVQLVRGIGECELLEQRVRSGPLARDLAFPYHPHVTVAHEVPDPALDEAFATLADFECRFEVDSLHLYEHGVDGVWRPETAFTFGGGRR